MYALEYGQPPGGESTFQTPPHPPLPSAASPAPMPKRAPVPPPIRRQVCYWAGVDDTKDTSGIMGLPTWAVVSGIGALVAIWWWRRK